MQLNTTITTARGHQVIIQADTAELLIAAAKTLGVDLLTPYETPAAAAAAAAAPAPAAGNRKAEKPAVAPAPARAAAAASAPAPAASAPAASAPKIDAVDYPTLQKAVFKLAGLDRAAAGAAAKSFGVATFKDLPADKWAEALATVNKAIAGLEVPA